MNAVSEVAETWRDNSEFKKAVQTWARRIRVRPTRVRVQAMRRKWASCSHEGIVTFSTDLLRESRSFGEAVIVHELIHLRVRNHGPLFRSLFRALLPQGEALLDGYLNRFD
jgi:predicted metal-dependent hydrolase